jgi:hypothetical protein
MPEQLTVADLDRVLFTLKNPEDKDNRIAVSAKDATPQQFHKWATGRVLDEDSNEQWTPEDRAEFCNVLYQHGRIGLIKKEEVSR